MSYLSSKGLPTKPTGRGSLRPNRQHPLDRNLVVNVHMGENPHYNIANGRVGTFNGPIPVATPSLVGMGSAYPGGSDRSIDIGADTWMNTTEPFTIAVYAEWNDATESFPVAINLKTNSDSWRLFFSDNASYSQVSFGSTATWFRLRTGASSFPKNEPGIVVVRYNGAAPGTAGNYDAMINGVDVTLTAAAAFGAATSENVLGKQGGFDFEGNLFGFLLWQNRRLNDWACRAVCHNFWAPLGQMLAIPPYPLTYFVPEAAPPSGDVRPRFYHHRHHNRAA